MDHYIYGQYAAYEMVSGKNVVVASFVDTNSAHYYGRKYNNH